jgi:Ni,Fe-hydrogenase III component G
MEAIVSTNEENNYSISELNYIRETIENMSKSNQIEVLRILEKYKGVILNENKYGVHINLTELKKDILDELMLYIKYVNTQEINLNIAEKQKSDYRNTFFVNEK